MTWKRQSTSTSVEVELHDFSEKELLQALINSKWITEKEAEIISERASSANLGVPLPISKPFDPDYLDDARRALLRGNRREAVLYIERHLGREWIGTLL